MLLTFGLLCHDTKKLPLAIRLLTETPWFLEIFGTEI